MGCWEQGCWPQLGPGVLQSVENVSWSNSHSGRLGFVSRPQGASEFQRWCLRCFRHGSKCPGTCVFPAPRLLREPGLFSPEWAGLMPQELRGAHPSFPSTSKGAPQAQGSPKCVCRGLSGPGVQIKPSSQSQSPGGGGGIFLHNRFFKKLMPHMLGASLAPLSAALLPNPLSPFPLLPAFSSSWPRCFTSFQWGPRQGRMERFYCLPRTGSRLRGFPASST